MTTKTNPKAKPAETNEAADNALAEVLARLERLEKQNADLAEENKALKAKGGEADHPKAKTKPVLLIHPKGHDHVLCDEGSPHFERCSGEGYQPLGACKSTELKTLLQSRSVEVKGQPSLETLRQQVLASCWPQAKQVA